MLKLLFILGLATLSISTTTSRAEEKTNKWISPMAGIATHRNNASDGFSRTDPQYSTVDHATVKMGGLAFGARSGGNILKGRADVFFLQSETQTTNKGIGDFTGTLKQSVFGMTAGLNITDFFYVMANPIPFMNVAYVQGSKIKPTQGRTTDLGRTIDGAMVFGAGVEIKFVSFLSIGAEWRQIIAVPLFGPDSGGSWYRTDFFNGNLKFWF